MVESERNHSVLKRVLAAAIAGFLILTVVAHLTFKQQKSDELNALLDAQMEMLSDEIRSNIEARARWMETVLHHFQQSPENRERVSALLAHQRQRLLELSRSFYEQLNRRNRVTHMYLLDAERRVVLRMHQPGRFGDLIDRESAVRAAEEGAAAFGVELGPLGTLTLRVVVPWVYMGETAGYLELGIELADILEQIEEDSPFDILLLIDKSRLNADDWRSGRQMLGGSSDWDLLEAFAPAYPLAITDRAMVVAASAYLDAADKVSPYLTELKGVLHGIAQTPFIDTAGNEIGKLLIFSDLSMEYTGLDAGITTMMLLFALIMICISLLIYLIIRRAEQARDRAEQQLQLASAAVAHTVDGIIITDPECTIIDVNHAFERVTGYSREEAVGNSPAMLSSGEHDDAFYQAIWRSIAETGAWQGRIVNRRKNGDLYPERLSITAIRDEQGRVVNYIGVFSDVSESEALEQQLQQASKMEALTTVVGGVAHEFNNLLAGLTGNIYLAKSELEPASGARSRLEVMENIAFQAAEIIRRLLAFTSHDIVNRQSVDLVQAVGEVVDGQMRKLPQHVRMTRHFPAGPCMVNIDSNQLEQAVSALLANAGDATRGEENAGITVTLEQAVADDDFVTRHPEVSAGRFWKLSVADNGHGIAGAHLEHVFEPFYTTREVGEGQGLGLSLVFGVMRSCDGAVEVESEEGAGTKVHLYFPAIDASREERQPDSIPGGNGETILVVDDDRMVLEATAGVLEKLGYRVLTASNGREAIEAHRAHPEKISLILMDVVMPYMGGIEAASAIRKRDPDIKLLFATGFDVTEKLKQMISGQGDLVLNKPYKIRQLATMVRQVLDDDVPD